MPEHFALDCESIPRVVNLSWPSVEAKLGQLRPSVLEALPLWKLYRVAIVLDICVISMRLETMKRCVSGLSRVNVMEVQRRVRYSSAKV